MNPKAWAARDENGELWLFFYGRPHKSYHKWCADSPLVPFVELNRHMLPSVKWEDDEPTEVEIIIKPKKK